jgi:demethylmenaquinone methyltransferase/2-methoxy-6-polyprenyl-1,4-benzoquinol methylase
MKTAPHGVLKDYFGRSEERRQVVVDMFDRSAHDYDWINEVMSLGRGRSYRREALERHGLQRGMRLLDVATGTGLTARAAIEILGNPSDIVGLDPSRGMLLEGTRVAAMPRVQGIGEALPFPDNYFDFLSMGYALRHVENLEDAFREYARVLVPGGRVLLLEITRPQSRVSSWMARLYLQALLPFVARVGGRTGASERLMKYHWETIDNCVRPDVILSALAASGFTNATCSVFSGIFSEYTAVKAAAPAPA